MQDSLTRIKKLQSEVWAIKLADRITNLQSPPKYWDNRKVIKYHKEAQIILNVLKDGNEFLAKRLEAKIEEYGKYIRGQTRAYFVYLNRQRCRTNFDHNKKKEREIEYNQIKFKPQKNEN